jgi:hypothetical protein
MLIPAIAGARCMACYFQPGWLHMAIVKKIVRKGIKFLPMRYDVVMPLCNLALCDMNKVR